MLLYGSVRPFWTVPGQASINPGALLLASHLRAGAQVAQLVEHVTENHGVGGSIPPLGTIPARSLSAFPKWDTAHFSLPYKGFSRFF